MTRLWLLLLLWGGSAWSWAAETAPLRIEADRVTLDEASGVSVYEGRVRADQEPWHLQAERLRLYRRGDRLVRVEAEGRPAVFTRDDQPPVVARARHIDYRLADRRVVLTGSASLQQGGDRFEGERIEYDLAQRRVIAEGGETGGRVRVIIAPETLQGEGAERR